MAVGIVCEYNPFHNGHVHHIKEIKKMYPNEEIVLIMSGPFLQRGDTSIINKWDKTDIALNYVDIVVELPFVFASQSADIFAHGAIGLLKNLKVDKIVFGSETNDIDKLKKIVQVQFEDEFKIKVKEYLDDGKNYPTALSLALIDITGSTVSSPNDILAISYIKEIYLQKANITPISIKRTNDYHSKNLEYKISSATSIRDALKKGIEVKEFVPKITYDKLNKKLFFIDKYFDILKYKILSENDLSIYQTVDEGIENKIKKEIISATSLEDLILKVKSKRYTYNKIKRMFVHILCNFTKEEAKKFENIQYIRLLGFTEKGKNYLNKIKKELDVPIITGYSNIKNPMLDLEFRVNSIYASILNGEDKIKMIEMEYKNKPIIKKD